MTIGLLGTGRMGSALAMRLMDAGHRLRVWNRTPNKAELLEKEGAFLATTPLDAAQGADVLISTLANDEAVAQAVLDGETPAIEGLDPGAVHMSMSTISPLLSARLARAHDVHGHGYVSAPMLGRPEAVARGELVLLTAGASHALLRCEPLFDAMAKETEWLGDDPIRANVVKLAVNFMLAAMIEGLGEAFALVERYGVTDDRFLEIVNGSSVVRDRFLQAVDLGLQDVDWSALARAARTKTA